LGFLPSVRHVRLVVYELPDSSGERQPFSARNNATAIQCSRCPRLVAGPAKMPGSNFPRPSRGRLAQRSSPPVSELFAARTSSGTAETSARPQYVGTPSRPERAPHRLCTFFLRVVLHKASRCTPTPPILPPKIAPRRLVPKHAPCCATTRTGSL